MKGFITRYPQLRRCLRVTTIGMMAAAVVLALLPRPEIYQQGHGWSRAVMDRHGKLLHLSMAADSRYRLRTSLDQISPEWIEATLAKEDRWFHWHPGINPVAMVRAAWGVITGRRAGGASTLTMQVARLRWGIDSSSVQGKLVQMFRAIQLERHYTKDEILEAYFNLAPYGGNVEGAGAAARLWCGRDAAQVTRREAIALSVIPQSPSSRHPVFPSDARRIAVAQGRLSVMLEKNADLRADPLAGEFTLSPDGPPPHEAPHFCRRVMRGNPEMTIHSTLDFAMQQELERGIEAYLGRSSEVGLSNACAILVHAPSREVLAYVGSADYMDRAIHGMVDGVRALRSPGSAVKPFIFGLALDQGLAHPRSLLTDEPMHFRDYNPENFEGEFLGPIHADEALVRSRNIPAVALANRLAGGGLYQFLQDGGVGLPKPPGHYGLALALGGFGISPEQIARLYAALADDGKPKPLVFSTREKPHNSVSKSLLSAQARFLVLDMMRGAANLGIDDGFSRSNPSVAWKTGTSHGFRDAWAIGVRGDYVLVVWLGNFNGRGNNALIARKCAVPLMFDLFARLQLEGKPVTPPDGVRQVELCVVSGELPGPWCRQLSSGWFIPGVSPISLCQLHREILVDSLTGKRVARDDGRPGLRREIHEFWPPDMLELFRQAGLPRRSPPEPENGTDTLAGINHGEVPRIVSPLAGRIYQSDGDHISLRARVAPGVAKCYWFSGEAFIGASDSGNALGWKPAPGSHKLRVIDDHGRTAEMQVRVGGG